MFHFAIDRGGTFTDVWCLQPNGSVKQIKLLSVDPQSYADAPREGIRRIIQEFSGNSMPPGELIDPTPIAWVRMGTTVATNALLERTGERMALLVTKGFKDLLYIGNQARPNIFDLRIIKPDVLYETVIEVEERIILHEQTKKLNLNKQPLLSNTGDRILVHTELNITKLKSDLVEVYQTGIRSIAVVLMHSYLYDEHEIHVRDLASQIGFSHITISSAVMPMSRIVPRGHTACADAYLTPSITNYINGFASGFVDGLKRLNVLFMMSDGGLTSASRFIGCRAMLSGPAGGVVGYSQTCYNKINSKPVIGFDMGGTSTDVSRYAGNFELVMESVTAGITVQAPQLDINTVAAGGGSRLFFRSGMFVVGPESAGAHPGPVCYKKGGFLTITDANLVLGRLIPEFFPYIFGPNQDEPLDKYAAMNEFRKLTNEINEFLSLSDPAKTLSLEEVAIGFISVANETMCRPIRSLTQGKGYDTSKHVLACFGGAGGQHACSIARSLGMSEVHIHKYAGILSAFGMALADVVCDQQSPFSGAYSVENAERIDVVVDSLITRCTDSLCAQGFNNDQISFEVYLHLRYQGTDCCLMCTGKPGSGFTKYGDFERSFTERYKTEFGFTLTDRDIIIDDIRVRAVGRCLHAAETDIETSDLPPTTTMRTQCYFENKFVDTEIYKLEDLKFGHELYGPAIIMNGNSTVIVEPECVAKITEKGDVVIEILTSQKVVVGSDLDSIQLSIFSHRFMSIAEQMGRVLQRTSISTNIKERLDFSCAIFGPDGGLVANAPHIPVHLGAMQETVQYQIRTLGNTLHQGDVILSNHPTSGGSHLPDLTVITPVFDEWESRPVFYVACRGHHADIGGLTPGSMPPNSTTIFEEGAVFKSFKLVDNHEFQEKAVIDALNEPARQPGCSGTRNLSDNLSDLRAQVAANQKGIILIKELIQEYGLDIVQAYMGHIQANAEVAIRGMLKEVAQRYCSSSEENCILSAVDYMDDGSIIKLQIDIDKSEATAKFDFSGTSEQSSTNINAPRAVTLSAIIYCLRCMVDHDIPLNQGCLKPVEVTIPVGSFLNPSEEAAVVGGNVLTSQRIVDVIFKAFNTCAASQGCMNNITFGDGSVGYYETVAGGAGAGPDWVGRSGIHTHMTNTRITDPEIVERRYPIIVNKFSLRPGSGGRGLFHGGDGLVRELTFCRNMMLSILTERRVYAPYGLNGGGCGEKGKNTVLRKDGTKIILGAKQSYDMTPGDTFLLETPGGGGYGEYTCERPKDSSHQHESISVLRGSLCAYKSAQESA